MKLVIRFSGSGSNIERELEQFLQNNKPEEAPAFPLHEAKGGAPRFPALFKHMTLAIWKKTGRSPQAFQSAFMMALNFLITYGYLSPKSSPARLYITGKGKAQNAKHESEPQTKSANFDAAYMRYVIGGS